MSWGNAILGGLLFGTPGFVFGALMGNDRPEVININLKTKDEEKTVTIDEKYSEYLDDDTFIDFCDRWSTEIIGKSLNELKDWTDNDFEEVIDYFEAEKLENEKFWAYK